MAKYIGAIDQGATSTRSILFNGAGCLNDLMDDATYMGQNFLCSGRHGEPPCEGFRARPFAMLNEV